MQVLEKTRSLFMRSACVILKIAKVIAPNSFFNRVYLIISCFFVFGEIHFIFHCSVNGNKVLGSTREG